ncbi:MAG: hypothetical protein AB7V08_13710 [Elusimicrobiales bacterium]
MAWTKKNRKDAARVVRALADEAGSITKLAEKLKLSDRAVVTNWLRRGSVPLDQIRPLLGLVTPATETALGFKPTEAMLNAKGHLIGGRK